MAGGATRARRDSISPIHAQRSQRLLSELSKRGGGQEEEARRATAVLQRLQSLLAAVQSEAGGRSRMQLRRALEIAMQQLAP